MPQCVRTSHRPPWLAAQIRTCWSPNTGWHAPFINFSGAVLSILTSATGSRASALYSSVRTSTSSRGHLSRPSLCLTYSAASAVSTLGIASVSSLMVSCCCSGPSSVPRSDDLALLLCESTCSAPASIERNLTSVYLTYPGASLLQLPWWPPRLRYFPNFEHLGLWPPLFSVHCGYTVPHPDGALARILPRTYNPVFLHSTPDGVSVLPGLALPSCPSTLASPIFWLKIRRALCLRSVTRAALLTAYWQNELGLSELTLIDICAMSLLPKIKSCNVMFVSPTVDVPNASRVSLHVQWFPWKIDHCVKSCLVAPEDECILIV